MMIISVLYPVGSENSFNLDYYLNSHVPLVKRLLEPMGLRDTRILTAGPESAYPVIAELGFDDLESLNAALAAHGAETQADIPNFTDVVPIIQISEVVAS
jgi:uncharacterized protein (TIGR02118 family)